MKKTTLITVLIFASLAFVTASEDDETIAPPLTKTNEILDETSNYLTVTNLKKQLDDTGAITINVKTSEGDVQHSFSREDLEKGKPECFNPAEPWNVGCVPV